MGRGGRRNAGVAAPPLDRPPSKPVVRNDDVMYEARTWNLKRCVVAAIERRLSESFGAILKRIQR